MPNFDGTDPLKRGRVIGGGSDPAAGGMRAAGTFYPMPNQLVGKNTRLINYKE
jgi:hypothetical protein